MFWRKVKRIFFRFIMLEIFLLIIFSIFTATDCWSPIRISCYDKCYSFRFCSNWWTATNLEFNSAHPACFHSRWRNKSDCRSWIQWSNSYPDTNYPAKSKSRKCCTHASNSNQQRVSVSQHTTTDTVCCAKCWHSCFICPK